mgnify:CR=1 FL=1
MRVRLRLPALTVLVVALAAPVGVQAAGPNDVVVTGLEKVEPSRRQARFDFVTREIAMTILGVPNFAVAALGLYEAELAFDNRIAFIHTAAATGEASSPWQELAESGEPDQVVFMPSLTVRKGLPWSLEIGGDVGWYAGSRQFLVGGFARWVPFGNWEKVPDVGVGIGYRGLIGNDQLDLGVFHLDLSIGYSFRMNLRASRPGTRFSPFAGYQFLQSHARPGITVDQVSAVSGWAGRATAGVDPRGFRFHRGFIGMEVRSGAFAFRIAGSATFPRKAPVLAGVDVSIGLRF